MAVITLSRQSGSGGNQIAEILAQRLGYRVLDKNLISQLVQQLNSEPEKAVDLPEKSKITALVERILNPLQGLASQGHEAHKQLGSGDALTVSQLRELIMAAYKLGNVVIVGRGGQIILAGQPGVLHTRIVAPLEKRVQAWQERDGIPYKEALRKAQERDKAHVDFVKSYFDADVEDPTHYDLVINTAKFSPEDAAELIIQSLERLGL